MKTVTLKTVALLVLLAAIALGGLTFSGNTQAVSLGSPASLDDMTTVTALAWIYRTAEADDSLFWWKGDETAFTAYHTCAVVGATGTAGALYMDGHKTTTDLQATMNTRVVSLNAWYFVGCQYNTGGVAGDQHLYVGNFTTPVAEVASYVARTAGTGTVSSDASFNASTGGNSATPQTFWSYTGRMGWVGVWNRALSIGEILQQQFQPHATSGNVVFIHFGYNGTSTQRDWSGNNNSGTVVGSPTVGGHVPILPFGR